MASSVPLLLLVVATAAGCSFTAATPPPAATAATASGSSAPDAAHKPVTGIPVSVPLPARPNPALWAGVQAPSPASVNRDHPGGDAPDPHAAALVRLLQEPLGMLRDKDDQVRIELPDSRNWRRVRFRGFPHLTGFKYGKARHAVDVVATLDTRAGRAPQSLACIRYAETLARPRIRALSVELGPITETRITWRDTVIVVHAVDGVFPYGWKRIAFSAAWAAYPAYGSACLLEGIGIKHGSRPDLAKLARDRWILDAASRVEPRTHDKPYRH